MAGVGGNTTGGNYTEEDGWTECLAARQDGDNILIWSSSADVIVGSQAVGNLFGVLAQLRFRDLMCFIGCLYMQDRIVCTD
jgi:hypothetical protein